MRVSVSHDPAGAQVAPLAPSRHKNRSRTLRRLNRGAVRSRNWRSGNAAEDGLDSRGWLLGAFIDPAEGVRSSTDVEVKWGIHPPGDKRGQWATDDERTTMVLLVQGTFRVDLTEGSVMLAK